MHFLFSSTNCSFTTIFVVLSLILILATSLDGRCHVTAAPSGGRSGNQHSPPLSLLRRIRREAWGDDGPTSEGRKPPLDYGNFGECQAGSHTRDLCESCSKMSKDGLAYIHCCNNTKDVRKWCTDFLAYTLPPH